MTRNKKYLILHSLKQHMYLHQRNDKFKCIKCNECFPFRSQLKIHQVIHTRKSRHMCDDCSNTYKFRHDMLKHKREHTTKEEKCQLCAYTGTKTNLKAHRQKHYKMNHLKCPLCQSIFIHRMSLWRHRQRCRRSASPDY